MRKTLVQCCFALMMAPILVCMLIGTIALAAPRDGADASGSGGGSNSSASSSGSSSSSASSSGSSSSSGASSSTTTPTLVRHMEVEQVGETSLGLKYGEERRLAVRVYTWLGTEDDTDDENNRKRDVTSETSFHWLSGDRTKVTASDGGRIRGVGVTTTPVTITVEATYGGVTKKETFQVTVVDDVHVTITEYTAAVHHVYATVGETKTLFAFVSKNGLDQPLGENSQIQWTSSDPDVVAVAPNGYGSSAVLTPNAELTKETEVTITARSTITGAEAAIVTCVVKPKAGTDPGNTGTTPPGADLPEGFGVTGITIDHPRPGASGEKYVTSPGSEDIQVTVAVGQEGGASDSRVAQWNRNGQAIATFTVSGKRYEVEVAFESSSRDVASVSNGRLTASKAGVAVITAKAGEKEATLTVEVSGFELTKEADGLFVEENESVDPPIRTYGNANLANLSMWPDNSTVATYADGKIKGLAPGTTTFTVTSSNPTFRGSFKVTVTADPNATIPAGGSITIKDTETLPFTDRRLTFGNQAGGNLSHITGLNVDASKGTLYYNYRSESEPGAGVGAGSYYYSGRAGGIPSGRQSLSDITFVPKSGFAGDVTIYYTAVSTGGQNYACRILLTVTTQSGSDAGIVLQTNYNTPIKFTSTEFNRVCRERLGVDLSYVVFSQPPERQGTLYTNYSGAGNYGSVVDIRRQYSLRELNDIWFVPAPGYSGPVTVYYTAYGVGTRGGSYPGQINITVNPEESVAIGGLAYDVFRGGVARFDDEDFNRYCRDILYEESRYNQQTLSYIRFDSLPSEREGVLYYDYRSSNNTGSRAAAGTSYYCGSRNPRIDRLAFVPAADFDGTVKLPFTGWTADGTRFTGSVEINVRVGSASGTGDIWYTCRPGQTVSFRSGDFSSLSQAQAGRTLDYIVFQSLPDSREGSLYYGSTRISSVGTRYQLGSISRLSFQATNSFSGLVNIPFEARAANGVTFHGVVTIGSTGTGSVGSYGNIRYVADVKNPAVFARSDFDSLSRWETDRDVSSIRFTLPASGRGTLYRGYRSASNPGTQVTANSTISASELDRVAFVPVSGYTGTVYIDFTATATGNGGTFTGTVEIEVDLPPADITARYTTRTEPVRLYAGDLARSGSTLSSIQFTALPTVSEGYLYYQYTSPVRYGQQARIGTAYRVSGSPLISDLTFVPRAGYTGTLTIPYEGTSSNGSTFMGEIAITVSPSSSSAYFSDMSNYSSAQRAAVDFLYDHNVTRGLTAGQYGPESSIRRGDFARMLYQAFELSPAGSSGAFRDVDSGAYYAEAVNTLYARGIVSGIGGGLYAPNSTLTRQDAICMVQRAMRSMGWSAADGSVNALYGYSDGGSVSGYAQGAMSLAVQRGYLPTSGGRLNPTQPLTRVDMAEIIHRVLTY